MRRASSCGAGDTPMDCDGDGLSRQTGRPSMWWRQDDEARAKSGAASRPLSVTHPANAAAASAPALARPHATSYLQSVPSYPPPHYLSRPGPASQPGIPPAGSAAPPAPAAPAAAQPLLSRAPSCCNLNAPTVCACGALAAGSHVAGGSPPCPSLLLYATASPFTASASTLASASAPSTTTGAAASPISASPRMPPPHCSVLGKRSGPAPAPAPTPASTSSASPYPAHISPNRIAEGPTPSPTHTGATPRTTTTASASAAASTAAIPSITSISAADDLLAARCLAERLDLSGRAGELVALGRGLTERLFGVKSAKAALLRMEESLRAELSEVRRELLGQLRQQRGTAGLGGGCGGGSGGSRVSGGSSASFWSGVGSEAGGCGDEQSQQQQEVQRMLPPRPPLQKQPQRQDGWQQPQEGWQRQARQPQARPLLQMPDMRPTEERQASHPDLQQQQQQRPPPQHASLSAPPLPPVHPPADAPVHTRTLPGALLQYWPQPHQQPQSQTRPQPQLRVVARVLSVYEQEEVAEVHHQELPAAKRYRAVAEEEEEAVEGMDTGCHLSRQSHSEAHCSQTQRQEPPPHLQEPHNSQHQQQHQLRQRQHEEPQRPKEQQEAPLPQEPTVGDILRWLVAQASGGGGGSGSSKQ